MKRRTKRQPTDLPEDALSVSQVTARVKDHLESRFTDVRTDYFAYNAVTLCVEKGIMEAADKSKFSPGLPVSGVEGVLMMRKLEKVMNQE